MRARLDGGIGKDPARSPEERGRSHDWNTLTSACGSLGGDFAAARGWTGLGWWICRCLWPAGERAPRRRWVDTGIMRYLGIGTAKQISKIGLGTWQFGSRE